MKTKQIALGDIDISSWKPGDKLYPKWMLEEDEDYALDPKEEILEANVEYTLKITYPLSKPYVEKLKLDVPTTREQVVSWIVDRYNFIYGVEDNSTTIKPEHIPGMLNRVRTDGEYGIWGHDIGDLILHTLYIDKNNVLTIGVDS